MGGSYFIEASPENGKGRALHFDKIDAWAEMVERSRKGSHRRDRRKLVSFQQAFERKRMIVGENDYIQADAAPIESSTSTKRLAHAVASWTARKTRDNDLVRGRWDRLRRRRVRRD